MEVHLHQEVHQHLNLQVRQVQLAVQFQGLVHIQHPVQGRHQVLIQYRHQAVLHLPVVHRHLVLIQGLQVSLTVHRVQNRHQQASHRLVHQVSHLNKLWNHIIANT